MSWDIQVPGCFGSSSLIFISHPAEEERAFAWLTDLRTRGVGWKEVRGQLEAYLTSRGASPTHIATQIADAEGRMKSWLLD